MNDIPTIAEAARLIATKKLSPVELTTIHRRLLSSVSKRCSLMSRVPPLAVPLSEP